MTPSRHDYLAWCDGELKRAFPDMFFDWHPQPDVLFVDISSHHGTTSRVRAGYPFNLDEVYDGAHRHVDDDTHRSCIGDRLIHATDTGYDHSAGHAPYILNWLVLPQRARVAFGDHPDVEPHVSSPSIALIHTTSRRLKVWADGGAVLHYDEPSASASASGGVRSPSSIDLTTVTLRAFQAMCLPPVDASDTVDATSAFGGIASTSAEAVALQLLRVYDGGAWFGHHRFAEVVARADEGASIDWAQADRLSTIYTEATVQDRAVLAVACHLSDEVTPSVSLSDALHLVGAARPVVLRALDALTGKHPDTDAGWPTEGLFQ